MSRRLAVTVVIALCFAVVVVVVACGGGGGSSASTSPSESATPTETSTPTATASVTLTGDELVTQRCDSCHGSRDRIAEKKWTEAQWAQEVQDMIDEQGAQLNEAEKAVVIAYLAQTYGP